MLSIIARDILIVSVSTIALEVALVHVEEWLAKGDAVCHLKQ